MIDHAVQTHQVTIFRSRFALFAMAALGLIVMVVVGTAISAGAARREAARLHEHTFEVLLASGRLQTAINLSVRGERGYLLTGDREFLEPYLEGRTEAFQRMRELDRLTRDNPMQQRNLAEVERRLRAYLAQVERTVELVSARRHDEALNLMQSGTHRRHINRALTAAVEQFEREEHRLLNIRRAAQDHSDARDAWLLYTLAGVGALLVALLALAIVTAARAYRRALELAEELQKSRRRPIRSPGCPIAAM